MKYRLSRYSLIVDEIDDVGHSLVYNTLSRSMFMIPAHDVGRFLSGVDESLLNDKLLESRIFVREDENESDYFRGIFDQSKRSRQHLNVVITTTHSCPMRCIYCFESGMKREKDMSLETAMATVSWLKDRIDSDIPKSLNLTFYGGEPLLNPKIIDLIGTEVHRYCGERDIRLTIGVVTGGTLINDQIVRHMMRFGLAWAQITLDGDRETHDRRRPYAGGAGTYDEIMTNIDRISGMIPIRLVCNVDHTNVAAAHRLIDILAEYGYHKKGVRITFGTICDNFLTCAVNTFAVDQDEIDALRIHALERGLEDDLRPAHRICAMIRDSSNLVINTNGDLYTCPIFIGRGDDYLAGNISRHEVSVGREQMRLMDFKLPEECFECAFVPFCAGGCRSDALANQGDLLAIDCKKELLHKSISRLLRAQCQVRGRRVNGKNRHTREGDRLRQETSESQGGRGS